MTSDLGKLKRKVDILGSARDTLQHRSAGRQCRQCRQCRQQQNPRGQRVGSIQLLCHAQAALRARFVT